ncbi:MAG: tagaturonate reductase [Bacteroidales bacterium]|nr:tagaturonate reductase [Bacteroidales bacterium]
MKTKILQFGEGNFLRAFVDWMIQKSNEQGITDYGVVVVQPIDQGLVDILKAQNCQYNVYLEGVKDKKPVKEITKITCIQDAINPYVDYAKYEAYVLNPDLEIIISNTTEAGIRYEEGEDIFAMPPASFPSKITALLYKRFQKFNGDPSKGLTLIPCELIEHNGTKLRECIEKHAKANHLGDEFLTWIHTSCQFADTLVDRIVSGFPKDNIDEIQAELGEKDNMVVKGEYFHVWAISPTTIQAKFPMNQAGMNVLFMDDITPFRDKKVRVLNGSHTAMVPTGLQMGCQIVMDVFENPIMEHFINTMVSEEILPAIDGDKNELKTFAESIVERFYNPFIKHQLSAISLNSLSKWEARNWPTVKDHHFKLGKTANRCQFSFAALMVLYSGNAKITFTPNDNPEHIAFIQTNFDVNHLEESISKIVKKESKIFMEDFSMVPDFIPNVAKHCKNILDNGMESALQSL